MHHLLIADVVLALIVTAVLAVGLIDVTPGAAAPEAPARISFTAFVPPQP